MAKFNCGRYARRKKARISRKRTMSGKGEGTPAGTKMIDKASKKMLTRR